jgi:hypothetical protein
MRAVIGVACLGMAWNEVAANWPTGLVLGLAGLFALFEAHRGWCLGRACGLKTPL